MNDGYEDTRTEYYAGLLEKKYFPLEKARTMPYVPPLGFAAKETCYRPKELGNVAYVHYDMQELVRV